MRTEDLLVIRQDGSVSSFRMSFRDAVKSFEQGKVEQVFNKLGKFAGIRLLESKQQQSDPFHRSSLSNSPASITKSECMANAGLAPKKRVTIAREKVTSWPSEHDQNNVVISAGIAYGVYCPLFDTNVHTPNFA